MDLELADKVCILTGASRGLGRATAEVLVVIELDAATSDERAARAAAERTIPFSRYGEPTEFARAAAFLLSPAESLLTGVMLPVDRGMLRDL